MSAVVGTLLRQAAHARKAGDRTTAVSIYRRALAQAPDDPSVLNGLANLLIDGGSIEEARSLFERATQADPEAPELWNNLAKAQRLLGNDIGERLALESALQCDQRNFMARLRSAELAERSGSEADAATHWAMVLTLAAAMENLPPALEEVLDRARTFLAGRLRDFERAIAPALQSARSSEDPSANRRFDTCVDALLGKRRIYSNECHGLHYPFLPAYEFHSREHFPWMARLEADTDEIRRELIGLLASGAPEISPYVQQPLGTPANTWTELDGSPRWSAFFLWKFGERIDEACSRCPATARAMDSIPRSDIPGRSPTVFFSILEPRTRIPPHTGVTNVRAIVHLPLIVPPNCGFRVGGQSRPWVVGEAFAFDDTIEHEAWNDSDEMRAVLIFDVWNPHLTAGEQRMLGTLFQASDASGFGTRILR